MKESGRRQTYTFSMQPESNILLEQIALKINESKSRTIEKK